MPALLTAWSGGEAAAGVRMFHPVHPLRTLRRVELHGVVPAARKLLALQEAARSIERRVEVCLLAGRLPGVEKRHPHGGRAGWLHPDRAAIRPGLTLTQRQIPRVAPHVPPVIGNLPVIEAHRGPQRLSDLVHRRLLRPTLCRQQKSK